MTRSINSAKKWARAIKGDVIALWIAARDPRTPVPAKVVAAAVASYALSPIDLIPDFIPVLGYLDDLLIVPVGILLAIRMVPSHLMQEFRARAAMQAQRPIGRAGFFAVVFIWFALAALSAWYINQYFFAA
ncbi:YkvA family protein [Shinella sp.]|uniref:YkvA family protein n=1 Tax=Shinella sp. TaxID=1870904 RepID=UPI0029B13BC3|nr:DUF1232 domain-containing protein [Shinella sp.]MDX3977032.1 DUF1232 domain-containing protein [Shinella sp.]